MEIRSAGLDERYDVTFAGPDLDALDQVDGDGARWPSSGRSRRTGSCPRRTAARCSRPCSRPRRGLPGPSPGRRRLVPAQADRARAPGARRAGGDAALVRARRGASRRSPPPWFVKPAVGRLSMGAHRVDDAARAARSGGRRLRAGWESLARLGGVDLDGHGWIAEDVLTGAPLTVEGYVHAGRVTIVGVTDSVMYEGTLSFERFEYPSRLPAERVDEVSGLAARCLGRSASTTGSSTPSLVVPDSGPPMLIELNGRIASQFAPLLRAVHGRSSYDALLALACGEDPRWDPSRRRAWRSATCCGVSRTRGSTRRPSRRTASRSSSTPGQNLSDAYANDPGSFRLAIVYEAGETREEAVARARARAAALRFRLAPLARHSRRLDLFLARAPRGSR